MSDQETTTEPINKPRPSPRRPSGPNSPRPPKAVER